MVNRGLYVGRFQPFHLGHLDAIKNVLKEVDELVIVIGSAQYSHSSDNPFTAGERLVMVHRALLEAGVDYSKLWIVPVPDVHLAHALGQRRCRLHPQIQRALLQ